LFENELLVAGGPEVSEDPLKGVLVIRARVSSVAAKGCNGIAKVGMGPQHRVYEGTEGALVGLGVHFRGCEFDQVFVGECWSGDRARVGHPVALEDLPNKFFLRQGEGAFLTVLGNPDTQDPPYFAEIGHLIEFPECLLVLEDVFEAL